MACIYTHVSTQTHVCTYTQICTYQPSTQKLCFSPLTLSSDNEDNTTGLHLGTVCWFSLKTKKEVEVKCIWDDSGLIGLIVVTFYLCVPHNNMLHALDGYENTGFLKSTDSTLESPLLWCLSAFFSSRWAAVSRHISVFPLNPCCCWLIQHSSSIQHFIHLDDYLSTFLYLDTTCISYYTHHTLSSSGACPCLCNLLKTNIMEDSKKTQALSRLWVEPGTASWA